MSNHLEQLTAEWLEHCGYFVRQSVLVGKRERGGFEGELDIVALNPVTRHLLHVECSLDADPWEKREIRFTAKFERGVPMSPRFLPASISLRNWIRLRSFSSAEASGKGSAAEG